MTLLTIRTSKRYAVRHQAAVATSAGITAEVLMIELSAEGCRVSTTDPLPLEQGDELAVNVGGKAMTAHVRWATAECVGLRFEKALFAQELRVLVSGAATPQHGCSPVQHARLAVNC